MLLLKRRKIRRYNWLVSFTGKSAPYLLETPAKDRQQHIQNIKAGEEQLAEIISVNLADDCKTATVTYRTKNSITPFGRLIKLENGTIKQRTAELIYFNNAWHFRGKENP